MHSKYVFLKIYVYIQTQHFYYNLSLPTPIIQIRTCNLRSLGVSSDLSLESWSLCVSSLVEETGKCKCIYIYYMTGVCHMLSQISFYFVFIANLQGKSQDPHLTDDGITTQVKCYACCFNINKQQSQAFVSSHSSWPFKTSMTSYVELHVSSQKYCWYCLLSHDICAHV